MNARTIRAIAREKLRNNWGKSVLAGFLASLLGGLIAGTGMNLNYELDERFLYQLPPALLRLLLVVLSLIGLLALVIFIIGGVVQLGYAKFLLCQQDGREHSAGDLFSQFHRFGTGFAQSFLRNLYTVLWMLLFIVPGIIKSFSYAMTPFILADHPEMTASEAITASKKLMDGHKGELFILGLTFLGWHLLSIITLGIANLWVTPYLNAAYASFYRQLTDTPRQLGTGFGEV